MVDEGKGDYSFCFTLGFLDCMSLTFIFAFALMSRQRICSAQ